MRAPEFSAEWYRGITEFAHGSPAWVHAVAETGTDGGLLLFGVLFLVVWWRGRGRSERVMALALLAPVVAVVAFLVSEAAKTMIVQERPCRVVAGVVSVAACPPSGDWSFPSNHATFAGASAVGLVVAWRVLAAWVLPLAVLVAFSRVFVGVHYPHDVVVGLLLGSVVAAVVVLVMAPWVARLVVRLRCLPVTGPLLVASSAACPAGGVSGVGVVTGVRR